MTCCEWDLVEAALDRRIRARAWSGGFSMAGVFEAANTTNSVILIRAYECNERGGGTIAALSSGQRAVFIVNGGVVLSGAQEPDVFLEAFGQPRRSG